MKLILPLIYLLFFVNCFAIQSDSIKTKSDSLMVISYSKQINNFNQKVDSLNSKLNDILKTKELVDWLMPIITFIIGIISVIATVFISKRQLKISSDSLDKQIESAKENIKTTKDIAERQIKAEVISKSKQLWLNTLRDCISNTIALQVKISSTLTTANADNQDISKYEEFKDLIFYIYKIKLLLNVSEKKHQDIEEQIDKIFKNSSVPEYYRETSNFNFKTSIDELVVRARLVIKETWDESKNV